MNDVRKDIDFKVVRDLIDEQTSRLIRVELVTVSDLGGVFRIWLNGPSIGLIVSYDEIDRWRILSNENVALYVISIIKGKIMELYFGKEVN